MTKISVSMWYEDCENCPYFIPDNSLDECVDGARCTYKIVTGKFDVSKIAFQVDKETSEIKMIWFMDGIDMDSKENFTNRRVLPSQLRSIKNLETKHLLLSRKSYRKAKIYVKDIKHTDEFVYEIIEK